MFKCKDLGDRGQAVGGGLRENGKGIKKYKSALAGVAQWTEHQPVNQRVVGSIPNQGTCLGWDQVPSWGCVRGNHTLMFLSLSFSLPPPLSKNK